jgi:hypothetical protein
MDETVGDKGHYAWNVHALGRGCDKKAKYHPGMDNVVHSVIKRFLTFMNNLRNFGLNFLN